MVFFMLLQAAQHGSAQSIVRYNTFSYSVNEGLLQTSIADIAVDRNNFCWVSFPNGVQKFDGKNFIDIPVQQGLPANKHVYFFRTGNGDLLLSHSQGISKYDPNSNRFTLVYKNLAVTETPALFIGGDAGIIYIYTPTAVITGLDMETYKVRSVHHTGLPGFSLRNNLPRLSSNIINHTTAIFSNYIIYQWDLQKGRLLSRSIELPFMSQYLLTLKSDNEVFFYDERIKDGLQLYNFTTRTRRSLPVKGKDAKPISRCIIYPWQNKTLLSFSNRLYEADSSFQSLKTELVNYQNQPISAISGITGIRQDNFGNLWIQTVQDGLKKMIRNNYPVKYYGSEKKEDNYTLCILPDKKNNRILAGTRSNGLLVFDTLQHLIKHIKTLPGKALPFATNNILKKPDGGYLLFVSGSKQAWALGSNLSSLYPIPLTTALPENKSGINYFANPLFQNEKEAVVQSQGRLYRVNHASGTVTEHQFTDSYTLSGIRYNHSIITHANDELIFLDVVSFKELKRISFKNTGDVRCFASAAGAIYMGTNNGIYKIDSAGNMLQHLTKETGLPDECIYAITIDESGSLWCSSNKGIFRVNKDNGILQLTKEDGLQENEFNTNAVSRSEDGEVFWGGVNGISSFYPGNISTFGEQVNLLLTHIKVNNEERFTDTALWNMDHIRLPYNQNSLAFDFIAIANNNPGQYIHQYQMEGVDKEWIQNNDLQTIRYFLPPGKYVFKMYAGRFFNKSAKPMKQITIIISPPFWKTWWFLATLGLLCIGLLTFGVNRYNKNKYEKKLLVLAHEQKIKSERERMSRDLHDSLGAYANVILYKTELLEEEQTPQKRESLVNDLKFASKDIITSLRETIWALNREMYTAEECLMRIRNFIQPLNQYYEQVVFRVEGDAPADHTLDYKKALHLIRIVQEAVTNSIKHASAANIIISSLYINDNWLLKVSDDGIGFDYDAALKSQSGNGLGNITQRATDAGFTVTVESRLESGSLVSIIV
jgi:signal transduction histidine kinase/ligand-binding sensor domain-containing protein